MNLRAPAGDALPFDLAARLGRGEVRNNLAEFGAGLIARFLQFIPTMMMAWSNKETSAPPRRPRISPERTRQTVRALADYLAAEYRLGRVRRNDFALMAESLTGALWAHAFLQVTFSGAQTPARANRAFVRRLVDALWIGLAPDTKQR